MIKAKGNIGGREVLLIGLSDANLDRLRLQGTDGYIRIEGREVGIGVHIVITAGPTEAELVDLVSDGIGPDPTVHISERLKS